jgi:ferric enterobactin receptor
MKRVPDKITVAAVTTVFFSILALISSAQQVSRQDSVRGLKEVAITGKKAVIKQKPDRIIYNLQADPESKGNSVLNMMRKIPYLSVDASDRVLLKGNSHFKVLINGKPSGILENSLTDLLRSMPASTIQSVEVITIPPSKYDAEGLAGIINIITNKKEGNGYSGTLNVNEQFPAGGPGAGSSFTLQRGRFGISAFGGANLKDVPETNNSTIRITNGILPSFLTQTGTAKSNSKNGYFGTELSYELDSLSLISGQLNFYGNRSERSGDQLFSLHETGRNMQQYELDHHNESNANTIDASINYQLASKADKNRLLTFSYRYGNNKKKQFSQALISYPINFLMPDYRQDNQERSWEQTVQIDYVYPLKKLSIEGGLKGIFRDQTSDFKYLSLDPQSQSFELQTENSDLFNYSQNVFSAYNSYILNLKSWSFQGGIRIEQTVINAKYLYSASKTDQNYFKLIPNISVNKNFASGNSINFGFTQRIKRPGIKRLNPFVNRINPNFETSGNPDLKAVLVNDMQAGYSISGKTPVTIGLDYSFLRNADLQVASFDPVTQITHTTYRNTGKIDGLSAFINVSCPLTKRWNASLNGNMIYFWIAGESDGIYVQKELLTYTANVSTGYSFEKDWRLNASLNISSRNPTGFQGTTNGMVGSSLSVNKNIIKDKLSVSAVASNPFSKYREAKTFTSGTSFSQTSISQNYFSSYSMSLNYNFGGLKGKIKKNKRAIDNDDISN